MLQAAKLLNPYGDVEEELSVVKNVVIQETCCKRSFLRGVFLASGSMSDPEKSYHFEIVCASMGKAQQIQKIMRCFALDAKIVSRKKSFVVYLKEGAQIVDVLNVMEAHQSLMELENIRILKDMRNTVNRKVNCETANINKTVSAAVKQIDDIRYIEETKGLDKLPEGLKEIGDSAFARSIFMHTLDLPSTLETIGEHAFEDHGPYKTYISGGIFKRVRRTSAKSGRQVRSEPQIAQVK